MNEGMVVRPGCLVRFYMPGQVPHIGLLSFVSGLPVEKLVGSEGILVTHQPVKSWLKELASANM
jgi:hypothetical protein